LLPSGAALRRRRAFMNIFQRQPHELGNRMRLLFFMSLLSNPILSCWQSSRFSGLQVLGIGAGGEWFIFLVKRPESMTPKEERYNQKWYDEGYEKGRRFARHEADYDELAAVYRAGGIPENWDIYRAEILNQHLEDKDFDFEAYAAGFARACIEFFEKI
jgi:hypothetical protein